MSEILVSAITLNYSCVDCDTTAAQPLGDITYSGTLTCGDCGEDMELDDTVMVD